MCGLFGYSFHTQPGKNQLRSMMTALMLNNDRRGGKGWGMFLPKNNQVMRGVTSIAKGWGDRSWWWLDQPMLLAHTRYPSIGAVKKANSHPFRKGHIVGAHNGCLSNHSELNKLYERKFEVDSEHIFQHLAEGKEMYDVEAYGAITWVDQKDNAQEIKVCKFNNGILSVWRVENHGIVYSSEADAVEEALDIAGLKGVNLRLDEDQIYNIKDGTCIYYDKNTLEFARYTSYLGWNGKKLKEGSCSQGGTTRAYGGLYDDDDYYLSNRSYNHIASKPYYEKERIDNKSSGSTSLKPESDFTLLHNLDSDTKPLITEQEILDYYEAFKDDPTITPEELEEIREWQESQRKKAWDDYKESLALLSDEDSDTELDEIAGATEIDIQSLPEVKSVVHLRV